MAAAGPVSILPPRHPLNPGPPFYTRFAADEATEQLRRGMPEQLRRSIDDEHATATAVWDPKDPDLPSSIGLMLDYIGSVLQPSARQEPAALHPAAGQVANPPPPTELSGRQAFAKPPGLIPSLHLCMLPDEGAVAQTAHVSFDRKGYLVVKVGRRPKAHGDWIPERAHRVVCWAHWGPPPSAGPTALHAPCVMHVCDSPSCLNSDHLVWGEDAENRDPLRAAAAARLRLAQQGRYAFP